jgi:hypothetical protein
MLRQRHNPNTGRKEWALVSHSGRVLKWFGTTKPSKEWFSKEEARIKYFKHKKGA